MLRHTAARVVLIRVVLIAVLAVAGVLGTLQVLGIGRPSTVHAQAATANAVTVFASGLSNPRGLAFGPDGYLYVAEGGPATNTLSTTPTDCQQVPFPVGPYKGGYNSRISKISPTGVVSSVATGLPSSQTKATSFASGVADVAFIDDTLYGIEAGAGCSHGLLGTVNDVFRVNGDGSTTPIADLSAFQMANPVAHPRPADFEPDGTWYSMIAVRGNLYAVEPNHGELDEITPDGTITRIADISASQGHIVPTALAYHGNFYLGNLNTFPVVVGSSEILKITPSGQIEQWVTGLTTVLGVAFDSRGVMYVLESVTTPNFPAPTAFPAALTSGMVVCVNGDGTVQQVASGLTFPTGITFGPDGNLYVSNVGFGGPAGAGQIVRITTNPHTCD